MAPSVWLTVVKKPITRRMCSGTSQAAATRSVRGWARKPAAQVRTKYALIRYAQGATEER